MEVLLLIIAIITLIGLSITGIELFFGLRSLQNLTDEPIPASGQQLPSISIIVSALNEEEGIVEALESLLVLNYPHVEIIAVNDRSTDKTPQLIDMLQEKYPARLKTFHIKKLPERWLGKNHALDFAAKRAKGEWLLFTDADVIMQKDILLKAMHYIERHQLDHLTIFEHHIRKTFWLKVLLLGHYLTYTMFMKPWRIRNRFSRYSLGHGAFNLVSRAAYRFCGGHSAIAMECMDDLKLGEMIKKNGFKQDTVDGKDYVKKEWYRSLRDMVDGVKKNSFSYFNYKSMGTFLAISFAFIFYILPIIGILFSGWVRYVNIINITLTLSLSFYVAKHYRLKPGFGLVYPVSIGILLYSVLNSLISTYKNKGVIWRGTFYAIEDLKNKKS